jgi:predicted alternative tryptophan synthase beta-subunit
MGLHKKLITTNSDIKNYDFYDENNILIIDTKKPVIPIEFIKKPYIQIPEEIISQYKVSDWANYFL